MFGLVAESIESKGLSEVLFGQCQWQSATALASPMAVACFWSLVASCLPEILFPAWGLPQNSRDFFDWVISDPCRIFVQFSIYITPI